MTDWTLKHKGDHFEARKRFYYHNPEWTGYGDRTPSGWSASVLLVVYKDRVRMSMNGTAVFDNWDLNEIHATIEECRINL